MTSVSPTPRPSVAAFALALAALLGCRQASREDVARATAVRDSIEDVMRRTLKAALDSSSNQVFMESVVEDPPEILSAPTLRYPRWLEQAGIEGRVIVQLILDTLGRAEPSSVKVIQTPNAGFDSTAMNYVLRARFKPGTVHGRPVRVLLNLPIDFKLTREQS